MVHIDKSALIGKGHHRECYQHPEVNNLCIKVDAPGNPKENRREKKYYRYLVNRGICWDMIPAFHCVIETNMGPGSVFDLILDEEGAASKSLQHYLSSDNKTAAFYDRLSASLHALKDYMLQQRIVPMTLKPKNILCKKLDCGDFRLFIIDNIGNSDFIPICNYSRYLARRKILRKWQRFEDGILKTYRHDPALQQMLAANQHRS